MAKIMKEKLIEKIKPHRCIKCTKSNKPTQIAKMMCVICKSPLCIEHMKEHIKMLKKGIQIPDLSLLAIYIKSLETYSNEKCIICDATAHFISYSNKTFCNNHMPFFLIEEFGLCQSCSNAIALYDCHFCHLKLCSTCALAHQSSDKHKPYFFRIADEVEEFNPKCSECHKPTYLFSFLHSNTICPECLNSHKSSSHTPTPTHTP